MESKGVGNPYDLNGQNFNPDMYFQKLLKECSLKQIMDKENEIVRSAQALHSDMQTLVYENYNKFISATETITKMKTDFKKMEDEMERLTSNMKSITSFSDQISLTLQGTRQQVAELSNKQEMLKKLQFLFKLPNKLKSHIQMGNYKQAVEDYQRAKYVLEQYGNMDSFKGIRDDCETIMKQLNEKLHEKFNRPEVPHNELSTSIQLLLELEEPADLLASEFLHYGNARLKQHLSTLSEYSSCQDMLDFVDMGIDGFLSDLCITVATYNDLFNKNMLQKNSPPDKQISSFVSENMEAYFQITLCRVENDHDTDDSSVLVRALDKFCRKLQATSVLLCQLEISRYRMDIVIKTAKKQCRSHLTNLKAYFAGTLANVRRAIVSLKPMPTVSTKTNMEKSNPSYELVFTDFLTSLVTNMIEKIKGVLQDLMVFLQPELLFSNDKKFLEYFCIDSVRENLVVSFLHHVIATARSYTDHTTPLPLLFILCKMCLMYHTTGVRQLLDLVDKWFHIDEFPKDMCLSTETELCSEMYSAAHLLINHFVRMQGSVISQMLRKSVETKDWLHGLEPRTVRPVMKRVIEELTTIDSQIGVLFEEGNKMDRSSDSSRKTHSRHHRSISNWSSYTAASSHSVSVISKIFSERVDIFAPVQFSKVSIMTGIIKISLKTLLECVRLKTFSRYGLQQVQVDTHYLQLYLWRFLHDENLVNFLLDDILNSAANRCLDPVLMEGSIVDIICERG